MTEVLPLWEILVPYKMGRKNVQVPYHQEWDAKVMALAGGMTLMRVARGNWVSPSTGHTHRELMIPVRIACSERQIQEIMAMTMEHYAQEAVFAYLVSERTLILHRPPSIEG